MLFHYTTDRLNLNIHNSDAAPLVLDFVSRGRELFEKYEPAKPPAFYTIPYQETVLYNEFQGCLSRRYVRFYVSLLENPDIIIGTVSFSHFRELPYADAIIGYKFDPQYMGMGYATEAVDNCISIVLEEFHLHRVEALIMPNNISSIRLVKRLGFTYEGTAPSILKIKNTWENHERYSLINPTYY